MKKIISKFIFFFLCFFKTSAIEIENFKALIEEKSEKTIEYELKVSFPSKLYKKILHPLNRKGEIYIYNNNNKVIFYPSINYLLKEETKEDDLLKVLKDIKEFFEIKTDKNKLRKRNIILQFKNKRLFLIKYPNNIKIFLKNYVLKNDNIYFPQEIEIIDKSKKIILNIKEINFNVIFEDKEFEVEK